MTATARRARSGPDGLVAGRRPGRRRRPGADGRLHGCRGAGGDHGDRRRPLPLPVPRPPLAQGRDQRQRPAARRLGGRLRRRRAARHGRSRRADLPSRHPQLLRPRRRAGRARRPRVSPGSRRCGRRSRRGPPSVRPARTRPRCSTAASTRPPARSPRKRPRSSSPPRTTPRPRPPARTGPPASAALAGESADLLYHLLVLLAERDTPPAPSSMPCGSGIAPEPVSRRIARPAPASPRAARSRAVACRCGRPATPRRSAPERTAASVIRAPLIVTPPPAISRRASPFDARSPASASSAALPAASHAGSNVNPPADAYRTARTAGSSIGSAENFAARIGDRPSGRLGPVGPGRDVEREGTLAGPRLRTRDAARPRAPRSRSRGSSVNQRR